MVYIYNGPIRWRHRQSPVIKSLDFSCCTPLIISATNFAKKKHISYITSKKQQLDEQRGAVPDAYVCSTWFSFVKYKLKDVKHLSCCKNRHSTFPREDVMYAGASWINWNIVYLESLAHLCHVNQQYIVIHAHNCHTFSLSSSFVPSYFKNVTPYFKPINIVSKQGVLKVNVGLPIKE